MDSIVSFEGCLDSSYGESILEKVNGLFENGVVNLVADFKGLRDVSSTGLGILLHISRTAREKGGHFKIANVNENVYEIIEIIGATTLLDINDDA